MAKRLESTITDTLINSKLLGKRKLGLPIKYRYEKIQYGNAGRFYDMLYFPKSRLDKFLGNIYERIMPGLKFFFWDEKVKLARRDGMTFGERYYHNFRHAPTVQLHAMGQTIHPHGYILAQRKDAMITQTQTLLPGIEIPEWANELRRAHDVDINSISVPQKAMQMVLKEATPTQHLRKSLLFTIQGFVINNYNCFGYSAQRLFYNEELRGDFYQNGYLTEKDKKIIHGWYADAQDDSQVDRVKNMTKEEKEEFDKNCERWDKNFAEFFPEFTKKVHNPILHKYDEPHYERNLNDIRSSIFTSKWIEAINNNSFNSDEIQNIHEFFLNENTSVFFTQALGEESRPTSLYKKFIDVLGFPDFFKIDRFTTYPPEKQFYDLLDGNWNINFDTVDSYRDRYVQFIKNNPNSESTSLVKEEVYNNLFRVLLSEKYGYKLSQSESYVLKALENGASFKELNEIAKGANENVHITNFEVLNNMVNTQVRKVVSTFNFKGNL